ncbi:MAG: hypothetical protein LBJ02_01145, partial [Bifidobacteriaceae bacterium]|nr:hypothetical protein [Bifidobacteriaceae bacterium]
MQEIMTGIGRWLAPTVLGIGLVSVGLAVCSATVWRPPEQISAVHEVDAATQALVADPGVMEAQADSVEIKVDSDRPMVMAIGRDTDVIAWVADSPAEHLTGFASRRDFTVGESGSDEPLASAAGSDLWIVSREYERGGSVKWQKAEEGRWSLVVAPANAGTEGEKVTMEGVRVTMTWQQTVSVPFLWPGVLLGGVLALAGAAMMVTGRGAPSAAGARAKAKTKAGPAGPAGGANAQPLLPGELPPGLGGGAVGLAEASEAADGTNQVSAMEQPDAVNQVDAALSAAAAASAAADPVPVSDDAVLAEAKPAPGGTFQESQPVELSDLRVGADGTASEPEAVLELEGVPQPEVEVPAPVPLGLDLPPIGLMEGAVTGFALEEAAEEPVADTADAVHVLSAQGPAGDISVGGPDAASTTAQPEPGEAPKSGADQTALSATAEVILPEPGEPILPGAGESALSGTGDLTRPGTGELALPEPGELIQSGAGEPPPPEPVFSASQALAAGPVPMTAGASDLEAPVNGLTRTYAGPVTSTTEGAEPAPVAPKTDAASAGATKKPKRRWFGRSAPAQTVEPAPQAAEPAVAEPPRVDLGHAAPNRSWERMAGPAWSGAQPSGVDSAADTGPGAGSTVAGQAEAFGSPAQGPAKGPGEELTSQPSQDGAGAAAGAANVPTDWMAASQNPVQSPGDSGVRGSRPGAGPRAQPAGAGATPAPG